MKYLFDNENARTPGTRLVTGSNNEEQTKIAQSDAAIGMLSFAWMNDEVVGVGIREGSEVIEPTLENVRQNRFPIARDLILIVAGEPEGRVKEFVDFIMGPDGQQIVAASGYIPVHSN
jgi:phosphate transport system substrate-binding protein